MQTLYNHLINEAAGNSSLCVDRLPNRVRTCDHELSARKLDWILKLRDYPDGIEMIDIAMYTDDLELLLEAVSIGARLNSVYEPKRIGPLVTRYLLEVGLTDKRGVSIDHCLRYWLHISCGKHQFFDLLDRQVLKPIKASQANDLWRACPLPSMREWLGQFPYIFTYDDLYAEEHLRQGLDHVVELSMLHSYDINFPRLIVWLLENDDRDSITRLWYPRDSVVANMVSTSFQENLSYGGHMESVSSQMETWWRDLLLEDWKFVWELMHVNHQNSIRNWFLYVSKTPVADWLLSLGCRNVFLIDPMAHFEWKPSNGIHHPLFPHGCASCAVVGAYWSMDQLSSSLEFFGSLEWASTQVLMYIEKIGTRFVKN